MLCFCDIFFTANRFVQEGVSTRLIETRGDYWTQQAREIFSVTKKDVTSRASEFLIFQGS